MFVAPEGSVTGYVAVAPGVTVADTVVNVGGVVDPDADETTSNCEILDVPPPGAGVCTVMLTIPVAVTADAGT